MPTASVKVFRDKYGRIIKVETKSPFFKERVKKFVKNEWEDLKSAYHYAKKKKYAERFSRGLAGMERGLDKVLPETNRVPELPDLFNGWVPKVKRR